MVEFLQGYGILIFIGLLFFVMMRAHGRGHGCGMGGHRQHPGEDQEVKSGQRGDGDSRPSSRCH